MNIIKPLALAATIMTTLTLNALPAAAEDHAEMALEHAKAAAASRDSKSVAEHASEALKHTESAKAVATDPAVVERLEKSQTNLNSAVQNANWHNTRSAADHARDSTKHLEAIEK